MDDSNRGTRDDYDEIGLNATAFDALERDFQEVFTELMSAKHLEKFRLEYEKLHRALKKAHESERRLIKKCRELNTEIVANSAKVQTAMKMSQEDQSTISTLKKEIEKGWKLVDQSHEKEAKARDSIQQLKVEIANLSKMVEQGAGLTLGQEHSVNELLKVKEDHTKDRDTQMSQIVNLRGQITELTEKIRVLEGEKISSEHEIHTLKELIAAKKAESDREQRRKERLEKELKDLKTILENKQIEIKSKHSLITTNNEQITRLDHQLREQKTQMEKALKDLESLNQRTQKSQQELELQIHSNTQALAENTQRFVEIKTRQEDIARVKQETAKMEKMRENLLRKISHLEEQKTECERQKDQYKLEISHTEREIEIMRKQIEADKKALDDLMRERDILNKNLLKAASATQRQADLVKVQENTLKNLEQEINGFKTEAQRQRKTIYQLERDRERYGDESASATSKFLQALEEVKIRDIAIMDLQKKIAEGETKLKQQQNLYEAVRSDRNLYSKNLIESQEEIAEMKRKFKIMNHQIEQLKEEISSKDAALVKEHFDHMKVEKEKENLKNELGRVKEQIEEAEQAISQQKAEIQKLNHIINEADAERIRQKKEYEMVINERDILGTQLIRRNEELAVLYEKIKIQQSTLTKGEIQYRQRLEDIRILKLRVNDIKKELHQLKAQVKNIDVLRNEVYHLQRELLQERTKVKALSEELENPMNVHRWRKLEGSDPASYDMIQRIHSLQRKLIGKTEEIVEKDSLIQEKEKLYVELKNILARQPGPEVAEQLNIYQQNLKEKTKQLKAMEGELSMYQGRVKDYKMEIERIEKDMQAVKNRYFEQKRREQLKREKENAEGFQNSRWLLS
eukprot:TRINITY_DN10172_c0_g3_i1.p1 TRINITY_DN10172_c0_g3~~TRINITY_DN10172_c0_g3_i1.p1  ORF type:complete len:860 (+),score=260.50 TRINITY_DN10172_c0_g3_i1:63-2642(+)